MFKDIDILEKSVSLLINMVNPDMTLEDLKDFYIEGIYSNNATLSEKSKKIIEFTRNSTHLYRIPKDEGLL